jgi:hypothetical protein
MIAAPFFASGQQKEPTHVSPLNLKKGDSTYTITPHAYPDDGYDAQRILDQQITERKNARELRKRAKMIEKDPYFTTGLGDAWLVEMRKGRYMTYYEDERQMLFYKDDKSTNGIDLKRIEKVSRHTAKSFKKGQTPYSAMEMLEIMYKGGHKDGANLLIAEFFMNPRTQISLNMGYNRANVLLQPSGAVTSTGVPIHSGPGVPNNPTATPEPISVPAKDLNGFHMGISGKFSNPFTAMFLTPYQNRLFTMELGYDYYFEEPNGWSGSGSYSGAGYGPYSSSGSYSYSHTPSHSRLAFGIETPPKFPLILGAKVGVEGIGGTSHLIEYSHPFYEIEAGVQVPLNVLLGKSKEEAPLAHATVIGAKFTRGQLVRNDWNFSFWDLEEKNTFYQGLNFSIALRPGNLIPMEKRKHHKSFTPTKKSQSSLMKKTSSLLNPVHVMPQLDQEAQKAYAAFLKNKSEKIFDDKEIAATTAYVAHQAIVPNEKGERVFGYVLEPVLVVMQENIDSLNEKVTAKKPVDNLRYDT